jgi:MazG family protein
MPDPPAPPGRIPAPAADTPDARGEFARLVAIMRVLRSPQGCPWDREQSWDTLKPYVLEEAYEVVDAIDRGDADDLRGEIGDLVFEGVFLAQVASDAGAFDVADALRSVNEKLIRRHPHVFVQADAVAGTTGEGVDTPGAVVEQWQQIKARERAAAGRPHQGVLDGLPASLPALSRAHELGRRAARTGFDWPDAPAVLDKIDEEIRELRAEIDGRGTDAMAEELGDLLFALAQLARKAGLDPEAALRAANAKFTARFTAVEHDVAARGLDMTALTLDELEAIWQRIKRAR